jgi:hypothetical protein
MAQQHPGFRIAIAPPPVTFLPTQAPAIVTGSTFIGVPTIFPPVPVQQVIVPMTVPTYPTVIIPNQMLFPGQTFVPPTVPFVTQPFVTTQPFIVTQPFGAPFHRVPVIGTPRAEVLRQFGQPSVTIVTSTGETLHFTGGVTVIIQNGQVIGPR